VVEVKGNPECGRAGERIAAEYLRLLGYGIIERNVRSGRNEIDIVASDGDCLVFVEVKTRRSRRFGRAVEAVGRDKILGIRKAAGRYLGSRPGRHAWAETRIDVVSVELDIPGDRMAVELLRGVA
jgi:putative endonuclease